VYGKMKIFTGSAHPELAKEICAELGLPLGQSEVVRFANENLMVKILENVRESDVFVIQPSCHPVSDGLVEMLIMLDALKHASAGRITAVLPYFPYVRSDKKDRPRISIAARLMADLIQTAGADRVLTMDLHSPQIQGFFQIPADQLIAAPILCDHLRSRDLSNTVLVASDFGEAKELGRYANALRLPVAIIDKRRQADDDRAIATNLVGNVEGKVALLVDDEVASAGTLMEASNFLLTRAGALAVDAAAVHPVLCGPAAKRLVESPIRSVVVTNTLPIPPEKRFEKLTILSVAPMFAQAIRAIHEGDSVSNLFR
jgi:ribose-phosphate pyrophosphokinase